MNSIAKTLAFQSHTLNVVQRSGQIWLRAAEIAEALGYSRTDKVTQIYDRNQDEFTPAMTQNLKLRVKGFGAGNGLKDVRVFSLRGAHLVAMFARTEKAKEFRRWVLDILDRQIDGQAAEAAKGQRLGAAEQEAIEGLCSLVEFMHSWFHRVVPAVKLLNPHLAAAHDHFNDGATLSRGVVRRLGLRSSMNYAINFPWGSPPHELFDYRRKMGKALA